MSTGTPTDAGDRVRAIEAAATVPAAGRGRGRPPAATIRLAEGDRIDRYRVVETLGAGAMGIVVLARDERLDRKVALKLLQPQAGHMLATARLLREARAMARLSHPNVVAVHQVGTARGSVFIAMDFVGGGTLSKWCEEKRRSWQETVEVFCSAGRGLAAAHAAGVVHRDFKPDNVLIGSDGRVQVADFGLASSAGEAVDESLVEHEASSRSRTSTSRSLCLTTTGALLGTPNYMAPEQHLGQRADARADQFAFCVSLWQALFGVRPFAGDSYGELAEKVCEGTDPDAPGDTEVPSRIVEVLRRGLSRDPDRRYPSMDALLADLREDPATARRRRLVRVAAVAVFAIIAGVALFSFLRESRPAGQVCSGSSIEARRVWNDDRKAAMRAAFAATERPYAADVFARVAARIDAYVDAWVEARTDACSATRSRGSHADAELDLRMRCYDRRLAEVGSLVGLLADGPDEKALDRAIQATPGPRYLDICEDVEALKAEVPPPADPALRARVEKLHAQLADARALHKAGKYGQALDLAERIAESAQQTGHAPIEAEALLRLANVQYATGESSAAEASLRTAIERASAARNDTVAAHAWLMLLHMVGYEAARVEDAARLETAARAAVQRAGASAVLRADLASSLGTLRYAQGDYEGARKQFASALALIESSGDETDIADALNNLGIVLSEQGDYEAARAAYERALRILEELLGAEHPQLAMELSNLGELLRTQGEYEKAREHHERALRLREQALGPEHPDVAVSLRGLASVDLGQGHYEAARERYERALAIREKKLGAEHPDVAHSLHDLANVAFLTGDYDSARSYYERALAIWSAALGPGHPMLAHPLANLGELHWKLGQYREAQAYLERALAIREEALGPEHPLTGTTLLSLGRTLAAQRQHASARRVLARALSILERATGAVDSDVADARFELAKTLWRTPEDRARAVELARRAHRVYVEAGATSDEDRRSVERWLGAHRFD